VVDAAKASIATAADRDAGVPVQARASGRIGPADR